MFTRAANRLALNSIRTTRLSTNFFVAQSRFGSSKGFVSYSSYMPAFFLGLAGVSIAGFGYSICSDEFYEKTIPANLQDGEKIEVQVGPKQDDQVLVCKVDGKYYCVSNKCPHFGAPLGKGPLFNDKIFCPFHNAAFSVKDGVAEGGPMLNGLEQFEITEKDGELQIRINKSKLNVSRPNELVKPNPEDTRKYVIIGGGPSGLSAAETLRQSGYTGRITILSKEADLPYDRTILSKMLFMADVKKLQYRSKEFLETYGIEVVNCVEVKEIDIQRTVVQTTLNQEFSYDKLLIATGGSARSIPVEGSNAKNVHTLRDFSDVNGLKNSCTNSKKLVVIGASFIGLETAASIKDFLKDKIEVTIVDTTTVPYQRVLGNEVGAAVQQLHAENGIKFNLGVGIKSIETQNGVAIRVHLTNGTSLDADTILIGAGVIPNTQFVGDKLEKDAFGALKTDVFLQTSDPNIFAAGDVANIPYHYTGQRVRFEHINSSLYQGSVAALNMVGQKTPVSEIPFFWTRFWNKSLHYTGYAPSYDDVYIQGDLKKLEFIAWYIKNNRIVAISAMNKGPVAMIINEAMKQNVMPLGSDIKNGTVSVEEIKKRVEARGRNSKCSKGNNCCSARNNQSQASSTATPKV